MKRVVWGVLLLSTALTVAAAAGPSARGAAGPAPSAQAQQFALAGQKAMKLLVNKDGWYRVRTTDLAKAGFALPRNMANVQLWANGAQVPILTPRGAIEFYGQGLDTQATDSLAYWLVLGKTKGLRIAVLKAPAKARQPSGTFTTTTTVTPTENYNASILNGDATNIVGPDFGAGSTTTVKIGAPHVDPSAAASLKTTVLGFSLVAHTAKVTVNTTAVGSSSFRGQALNTASFPVPAGTLKDGDNAVTYAATAGDIDIQFVQALTLTYQHSYLADSDVLDLPVAPGRVVTVGGFTTKNIRVIDVSRPTRPRELVATRAGAAGNFTASLAVPGGVKELYEFANYKALSPVLVPNIPSTLNVTKNSADLVIIAYRDFIPALAPLVELRQKEGFQTVVTDVQDVYDEFSFGVKDPAAITAFLAWTRAHWTKAPHYVLLVGDASNDPRNLTNQGSYDFVPTIYKDTQYLESPSDDSLADFNGDGIPEMAVGRLPVRTLADAQTVVSKLVRYDSTTGRPRTLLAVADKNIDYDFEAQSQTLFGLLPSDVTVTTVYRNVGPTDAAVRSRLLAALNTGPTIVNFFGHGAISIWTSGSILKQTDAANLTNTNALSLYLMMTCLNGYFVDPKALSLGEALLLSATGGAVATWSSSGETVPTDQVIADQQAVKLLLTNPNTTLGDAMLAGKSAIHDFDVRHTWVLLGDPTTRLH
jgi:hypothetical protein